MRGLHLLFITSFTLLVVYCKPFSNVNLKEKLFNFIKNPAHNKADRLCIKSFKFARQKYCRLFVFRSYILEIFDYQFIESMLESNYETLNLILLEVVGPIITRKCFLHLMVHFKRT